MNDTHRPLVVGVDYSDQCICAVDEALRMASSAPGTPVVPVLVLPSSPLAGWEEAAEMTVEVMDRSRDNLLQLVQTRARALGLSAPPLEPRVRFGAAAEQLLAEARERDARLISIGTHGRGGLSHLFLGSVAEAVMRQAPCSVLIARASEAGARVAQGAAPAGAAATGQAAASSGAAAGAAPARTAPVVERTAAAPPIGEAEPAIVNEPHIDAGRVVVHVLDAPSGQVFVVAFDDEATLRIDPIEGGWVPAPSSDARARVARAARALIARELPLFEELFAEVARRRARAAAAAQT